MKVIDTLAPTPMDYTHILHFADIHIRSGDIERSRYDEYDQVFKNTIEYIDNLQCIQDGTALVVIAGDLFHHKGKMDTPALKLYFSWMDQLLARAPVVMICGNHDFRQEDPRHPDMMETMSLPYEVQRQTKYPLVYLKQTGHYQMGNLGFGVVSVKDTLRTFNTSGQVDKLPPYPSPKEFPTTCATRIALFHGTISQSALPNEQRLSQMSGYPLQWFEGYDMVLLGDNHKNQYHTTPQPWGYPGSLIQQDFGESTFGHGFLLWNVQKKTAKHHHIPNPYGMITMKWMDKYDQYGVLFGRRDVCEMEVAVQREHFPTHPRVRILGGNEDDVKVKALLEQHQISPTSMITSSSIEQVSIEDATSEDVREKIVHLADFNEPVQWVEYLHEVAPELDDSMGWFTNPESLCVILDENTRAFLPKDIVQKITDRNARIQKAIDEYRDKMQEKHVKYRISLQHMSWDYAMCYGQGNYFDFKNIRNNIALLNGRNASGKSSFLDVLCIGLYGEPTKHRNMLSGKKMTAKMIHDHRPPSKSVMKVAILFEMDDKKYEIVRSFTTQKKEDQTVYAQLHGAKVYSIAENDQDVGEKELIAEGSVMVEQWITAYFGTIEDMLMSTILCQLDISNFFYLKQDEQKAILDHAMQLGSITCFAKVIKEATLAYNEWITLLRTSLQAIGGDHQTADLVTPQEMENMKESVRKLQEQLAEKKEECKRLLADLGVATDIPELNEKEITAQEKKLNTKLFQFADIENKTMESVYTNKGESFSRYTQCQEALEEIKTRIQTRNTTKDENTNAKKITSTTQILVETEAISELENTKSKLEKHKKRENPPSVSKEHLTRLDKDLAKWKSKYPKEWVEDPDQVHIMVQELQDDISKKQARLKKLQEKSFQKPSSSQCPKGAVLVPEELITLVDAKQQYEDADQEWKDLQAQCQELKLWREMEKYDKWRAEWKKWKQEVAPAVESDTAEALAEKCEQYESFITAYKTKQDEWERVMRDMGEVEKELQMLKEIPLNPECWACQKQPAMKRKEQLGSAYDKMKRTFQKASKYIKQYEQHGDIPSLEQELKTTRKLHATRMYYEQTKEHMENENRIWQETKKNAEELQKLQEKMEGVEQQKEVFATNVAILEWKQWNQWNQRVEAITSAIQELENQKSEMDNFLRDFDLREKDMLLLQIETDKYEAHQKWLEQTQEYTQNIQHYEAIIEYWELHREFLLLQDTVGEHAKLIQRMQEKKQLLDQVADLQKCRIRNQLYTAEDGARKLQEQYETARVHLVLYETAWKRHQDKHEQLAWYSERIEEWSTCKQKLIQLEAKFIGDKVSSDGYKEWIYREKVVPLLENEVNRFLSTIETIRLKIQYDKKCFTYFLEDRGNLPTLDKASGYQNFVVGLAMRLALSRIGAVGQNVRHLFIDEGFTACDVANIEKVPQLLRGVLTYGGYESIVVMSHLEQVQEACDCRIDIERKGMFSFVHYGDAYPTISVKKIEEANNTSSTTTTKKRGRPKKE